MLRCAALAAVVNILFGALDLMELRAAVAVASYDPSDLLH